MNTRANTEEAATLPDGDGARVHAREFVGLEILVRHAEDLRHVLLQVAERQLRISKALVVVKDVASHDRLDPHAKCLVGLDDVGRGGARRRWRERDEQREQQRGRGARRQAALRGGRHLAPRCHASDAREVPPALPWAPCL